MGMASKLAAFVGRLTSDSKVPQAALAPNVAGNGPAFSAYQSSSQSLSGGVFTKLQFQTEEFDTNSNYDKDTNYRFLPTVAGYYQVNASVTVAAGQVAITLYKNGTPFKSGPSILATAYSTTVAALIYLNGSTDYVESYGYVGATSSTSAAVANTYFQASMVRAA